MDKKSKALKLFAPATLIIGTVLAALVIVINPFNMLAIIKNNYPNFPF